MKRIRSFDIARSLCMLWIVGVWHMCSGYLRIPITNSAFCSAVTGGVLTAFFFMSGALANSRAIKRGGTFKWVKHKVMKLYPLYLISAVVLYFFGFYKSTGQMIATALCVGEFFPPMVGTIWFIEILLLFFVISPLFLFEETSRRSRYIKLAAGLLIYILLAAEHVTLAYLDERVLLYYPAYVLGLYHRPVINRINEGNGPQMWKRAAGFLLCAGGFTVLAVFCTGLNSLWWLSTVRGMLFAYSLLFLSGLLSRIPFLLSAASVIGYSSTFAYLFHRQVFGALRSVFGFFSPVFAYCVALPGLLVCSYFGQKVYDRIQSSVQHRPGIEAGRPEGAAPAELPAGSTETPDGER